MGLDSWPKTAVVTGPGSGLGLAVAQALARGGSHIALVGRDRDKLKAVLAAVAEAGGSGDIFEADLADYDAVRLAAGRIMDSYPSIDLLVNNAGIMAVPQEATKDGHELHLAVNYLSHFLLTALLVPALRAGGPARIVNVSSSHEGLSAIDWADPHYRTRTYDKFDAYTQSKAACLLHALALDQRLGSHGVRSFAVAPGVVNTALFRHLTRADLRILIGRIPADVRKAGLPTLSPDDGAKAIIWAATAPELAGQGGRYCVDGAFQAVPEVVGGLPEADRLWQLSQEWVGQAFAW